MTSAKLSVALALLLLSAGCSQLLGGEASPEAPSTDASSTEVPSAAETTPEQTRTTSPSETTSAGTPSDSVSGYDGSLATGEILLSLRDVPAPLNKSGERLTRRTDLTGDDLAEYRERGIERFHERTFAHSSPDTEKPSIVVSTATVYESPTAADDQLQSTLQNLSDNGATVAERRVAGNVTATEVQFENDVGLRTVGYYYRSENLVFYVLAADEDEYRAAFASEMFVEMLGSFRAKLS